MNSRAVIIRAVLWGAAIFVCGSCVADENEEEFENHIRPLLASRCVKCHGAEKQSGELRLDSAEALRMGGESGPVVVSGDPDASLLIRAVRHRGDLEMPPEGGRLSDVQIGHLEHWIKAGALWPKPSQTIASTAASAAADHWAFQPIRNPPVPDVAADLAAGFVRNAIDAFVLEKLQQAGLSHSPASDRRTWLRRVTYSLTGLPPTEAEVRAYLNDPHLDAEDTVVERLLASPAYGEHWARHWLDIARYADTKGYVYAREERFWVQAWSYRDWVVNALNKDMPYDRFLLMQIAADQIPDRGPDDLAAMGYLTLGRRFLGVQRDIIDDRIDVVTRGTMALTVGCARCHDHKYDPIPTADYYSLYGVFASCRERMVVLPANGPPDEEFQKTLATRQAALDTLLRERRASTAARVRSRIGDYLLAQFELEKYPEEGFDQVLATTDLLPSFVRRWQDTLRQAKAKPDRIFAAWHAYTAPKSNGLSDSAALAPVEWNPLVAAEFKTPPESKEDLARRYGALFVRVDAEWKSLQEQSQASGSAPPTALPDAAAEELRQVMYGEGSPCVVPDEPVVHTEYDFDSGTCNELWKLQGEVDRWIINASAPPPCAVILEDRVRPFSPRIFKRGNPSQQGEEVPRQFLKLLSGPERKPFQQGSGRLELAREIVDPHNPLTARVLVNRVWAHHFGQGLVSTPGDFGTRASPPSHPELLDWLASRLVAEGWSLKSLHRLIALSGTYRQTSTGPVDREQLAHAARIDPANRLLWRMNSHRLTFEEMRDSLLAASGQLDLRTGGKPSQLFNPPFSNRRTLYGLVDRQFLPGTLRVFDFANPDLAIPSRSDTTVPQQALFLMNHPMMLQRVTELAKAVRATEPKESLVEALYLRVLQRAPTATERQTAITFLDLSPSDDRKPQSATASNWSYGYGGWDEAAQKVSAFTPLPHFTGTAWQGGEAWPDAALGWVQLTAEGGHPGNDRAHACVRRWTAPADMRIRIRSQVIHEAEPGDGIRTFIASSQGGMLTSAVLHQKTVDQSVDIREVKAGETIDFVVDIGDVLNSDQYLWEVTITEVSEGALSRVWNSKADFPDNSVPQLTPLEQLAQVLLCSNEFLFVD